MTVLLWLPVVPTSAAEDPWSPGAITELLPLGGATVLLIYLLKVLVQERNQWVRERDLMKSEQRAEREAITAAHRAEMAESRAERMKERESDLARVIQLRSAIDHCNEEIDEYRKLHDADQEIIGRLRASVAHLEDELEDVKRLAGDG